MHKNLLGSNATILPRFLCHWRVQDGFTTTGSNTGLSLLSPLSLLRYMPHKLCLSSFALTLAMLVLPWLMLGLLAHFGLFWNLKWCVEETGKERIYIFHIWNLKTGWTEQGSSTFLLHIFKRQQLTVHSTALSVPFLCCASHSQAPLTVWKVHGPKCTSFKHYHCGYSRY